jgi:hypothetical protein
VAPKSASKPRQKAASQLSAEAKDAIALVEATAAALPEVDESRCVGGPQLRWLASAACISERGERALCASRLRPKGGSVSHRSRLAQLTTDAPLTVALCRCLACVLLLLPMPVCTSDSMTFVAAAAWGAGAGAEAPPPNAGSKVRTTHSLAALRCVASYPQ